MHTCTFLHVEYTARVWRFLAANTVYVRVRGRLRTHRMHSYVSLSAGRWHIYSGCWRLHAYKCRFYSVPAPAAADIKF